MSPEEININFDNNGNLMKNKEKLKSKDAERLFRGLSNS